MKITTVTTALIFISIAAFAQDSVRVNRFDSHISFFLGPQKINVAGVNELLQSRGIGELRSNSLIWGISSMSFRRRFGFGSSLDLLIVKANTPPTGRWGRMGGFGAGLNGGYYLVEKTNFALFPTVGLRVQFMNLGTGEYVRQASAGDLLSQPQYSASINYVNGAVDLGIGGQLRRMMKSREWSCPQADGYLSLDFRVGWNVVFVKGQGSSGVNEYPDAPKLFYQGPYFRIGYGLGTKFRRVNWK